MEHNTILSEETCFPDLQPGVVLNMKINNKIQNKNLSNLSKNETLYETSILSKGNAILKARKLIIHTVNGLSPIIIINI
jgi:hypothetical protein